MGTKKPAAAPDPKPRPSGFWRAWKAEPEANKMKRDRLLGQFLTAHEGFARKVMRQVFAGQKLVCEPEDAMQAARLGLLEAARRWEPAKGRFTTYAWWWIRKMVQEAITNDTPVRGVPGKARPRRVQMDDMPSPASDATPPDDAARELVALAAPLLEELTDEERELLLGPDTPAKKALASELREILEEMDW